MSAAGAAGRGPGSRSPGASAYVNAVVAPEAPAELSGAWPAAGPIKAHPFCNGSLAQTDRPAERFSGLQALAEKAARVRWSRELRQALRG